MKGGVAAMVLAVEVLAELDVPLAGDLGVCTTTDEEFSGAGGVGAVLHGVRADAGVVTEPTTNEIRVACQAPRHQTAVEYCDVTGQLIGRRYWEFDADGRSSGCAIHCEELYHRYCRSRVRPTSRNEGTHLARMARATCAWRRVRATRRTERSRSTSP